MKLYDLPQRTEKGVKLYGLKSVAGDDLVIIFDHIDGMYSYCWVLDVNDNRDKIVHLSAITPVKKYKDGYKVIA